MQQLHKQQIEYSEALNSLQKKVNYADKVAQENTETHQMNVKLTGELEDYRRQTKRLIYDIQQKDEEMVAMKQALAQRPSGNNEVSVLSHRMLCRTEHTFPILMEHKIQCTM